MRRLLLQWDCLSMQLLRRQGDRLLHLFGYIESQEPGMSKAPDAWTRWPATTEYRNFALAMLVVGNHIPYGKRDGYDGLVSIHRFFARRHVSVGVN